MKKIAALFLLLCMTVSLAACGEKTPSGTASSASAENSSVSSGKVEEPGTVDPVPNMVMAMNRVTGVFGIYDMDLYKEGDCLEDLLVWSTTEGEGADMKYREDTVFGDVIVVCSDGRAAILSYPEGKVLWETNKPGSNSHAIEILPSGDLVIANSTGSTLRTFPTSLLTQGSSDGTEAFKDYPLEDAHGVLWDPEYEVLWALGGAELAAYEVSGEGTSLKLTKVSGMGNVLPEKFPGGHDLSADFMNTQYLYLTTNMGALKFNKENGTFMENYQDSKKLSRGEYMKGLSNNPNGNFWISQSNFGPGTSWENERYAAWSTDRLLYLYNDGGKSLEVLEIVSQNGAFYKCRAFYGKYQ